MLKKLTLTLMALACLAQPIASNNTPVDLSQAQQIRSDYVTYFDKEMQNLCDAEQREDLKVAFKTGAAALLGLLGGASIILSCEKLHQLYQKKCTLKEQANMRIAHAKLEKERTLTDKCFMRSIVGKNMRYITKPFVGTHQNIQDAYIAKNIRSSMDRLSASTYNRDINTIKDRIVFVSPWLCGASYLLYNLNKNSAHSKQRYEVFINKLYSHPGAYLRPT